MSTSPELEDVSPTLARAVLPTYLHHVADASETLAVFARKGLSKNEAARSELVAQIELQREVCRTPLVVQSDPLGEDTSAAPFSRPHTPLSPGARATKRAAGVVQNRLLEAVVDTQMWRESDLVLGALPQETELCCQAVCAQRFCIGDAKRFQ